MEEPTGLNRPRVYRNAVLLVTPSREGPELLRNRVREYLAWREVEGMPEAKSLDDLREALLIGYVRASREKVPEAVVQAYNIVVTVSARGEIETVKKEKRSRIHESAISPDALLPQGPYDLWRWGETSRRASDPVRAFAQFPHLPKMLRQRDIVDTLALGYEQGYFVLRLPRPDKTFRRPWRTRPDEADLRERDLEVMLPESAEITELDNSLLAPGTIPGLWPSDTSVVTFVTLAEFFDGKHASKVQREGCEEAFPVPKADSSVLEKAVGEAVKARTVWLISGPASIFRKEIPLGVLTDSATLNPPTSDIPTTAGLPQNLQAAWGQEITSAAAIASALSASHGQQLPWPLVAAAIDGAIRGRLVERAEDSGPWPCDWPGAAAVRLCVPKGEPPPPIPSPAEGKYAQATLEPAGLQDLADGLGEILKAGAGLDLRFVLRVEVLDGAAGPEQIAMLGEALEKVLSKLSFE